MASSKCNVAIFMLSLFMSIHGRSAVEEPKRCKYGDTECVLYALNYYVHEKYEGDNTINLAKLDPLQVKEIKIKQGAENPVNVDLTFLRSDILGLSNVTFFKAKGFNKDFTERQEVRFKTTKSFALLGDYRIKGKVLVLPIVGSGKCNMTLVNAEVTMIFNGTPFQRNGVTHMKIQNMKLDANPERLHYHFSNLFNGDKQLGSTMNQFLNDNWREIYEEVRDSMQNAFARIFETVINAVLEKYPYEDLFIPEN